MGLVWYAAYGSNLDRRRLLCYLAGGCPPGSTRRHHGCRDRRPPLATTAVELPFRLYFAGDATSWGGGGVAFVATLPDDTEPPLPTLARAWLVSDEQLADIVAQENGRRPPGDPLPWDTLARDGAATMGPGWYEHLLVCGELDGHPVVTFTCAESLAPTPPGPAYRRVVAAGLRDAHGLTAEEADAYLAARTVRP